MRRSARQVHLCVARHCDGAPANWRPRRETWWFGAEAITPNGRAAGRTPTRTCSCALTHFPAVSGEGTMWVGRTTAPSSTSSNPATHVMPAALAASSPMRLSSITVHLQQPTTQARVAGRNGIQAGTVAQAKQQRARLGAAAGGSSVHDLLASSPPSTQPTTGASSSCAVSSKPFTASAVICTARKQAPRAVTRFAVHCRVITLARAATGRHPAPTLRTAAYGPTNSTCAGPRPAPWLLAGRSPGLASSSAQCRLWSHAMHTRRHGGDWHLHRHQRRPEAEPIAAANRQTECCRRRHRAGSLYLIKRRGPGTTCHRGARPHIGGQSNAGECPTRPPWQHQRCVTCLATAPPAKTRIFAATSGPSMTRTIVDTARSLDVLHTATGTPAAMASPAVAAPRQWYRCKGKGSLTGRQVQTAKASKP
jgi:hypothetical protein